MKTELLSKALERIENWPADAQDQLAEIAFDIDAGLKDVVYEPTDEELAECYRRVNALADLSKSVPQRELLAIAHQVIRKRVFATLPGDARAAS